MVMTAVDLGVPYKLFDADAQAAPVNSTAVALPRAGLVLNWDYYFASAPASVSIGIQASNDNTNWFNIDTGTTVGGEARLVSGPINYLFVRARKQTQSGGGAVTVEIVFS